MTKLPSRTTLVALPCTALALMAGSVAQANDDIQLKGGGFGTLGAVRTNLDGTQYRNSFTQWSGADRDVDLGVDSRLGLQGSVIYKSDFALTAQLLGIRREDDDFDIDVEWLYAQYTGVPGLDLKAGRVALPAFLVSDSRYVGYATPWLRVPPLVYSLLPYSTLDGVQAGYRHAIGPVIASVQATHGRSKAKLGVVGEFPPDSGSGLYAESHIDTNSPKVNSLNLMLEWGDWTARIGQVKSDVEMTLNVPAPPPILGIPPVLGIALQPFKDTFTGYGIQYDNGKALVIAEYVKRKTAPSLFDSAAWYAGAGYHFGEFMPYVVLSRYTPKDPVLSLPPSKGRALGVRYDFAKNLDLKAEFARYDTNGTLIFTDAATPAIRDKKVNVVSIALDFVF